MKNIRWALIATMALGLSACSQTFNGTLSILQDLAVSTKKGTVTVPRGSYQTKLKVKSSKKVELEIKGAEDDELEISLAITNNSTIPSNGNGPIFVSGADSNQSFNIVGNMTTLVRDSALYRDYRTCTYQQAIERCYVDANGNQRCRIEYITRHGNQWVEYFDREYTEDISADLKMIADGRVAGNFVVHDRYFQRYETYRSQCW